MVRRRISFSPACNALFIAAVIVCCTMAMTQTGVTVLASEANPATNGADDELRAPIPFVVDVWTNKGGQGPGEYGGDFSVDEELIVHLGATWDCFASIGVSPLGGAPFAMMDGQLVAGETYQLPSLQDLTSDLSGSWEVTVSAIAEGNVQASDTVIFTVGAVSSVPVVALGPDEATELDALVAVKMAMGAMAPDLSLDVDRDGQVTMDDARLILIWAVQ
jgi:hypothetical protein